MKAFAGRTQDWADVEGIVRRQSGKLACPYIFQHADELAAVKEDEHMIPRLRKLSNRS